MRLGYLHGVRDTVLLALHHAGSESPLGVAGWYYVLLGRGKNQEILGAVRVLRAHGRAWPLCADDRLLPDSGRHCCHLASKTSCTNERALTASYVVYMVLAAFGGMYVPFLFFSQQTLAQYSTQFGEDYMQLLSTIVSPAMAVAMLLVVALCAFLGSLIARKLLKKHFQKAGLV